MAENTTHEKPPEVKNLSRDQLEINFLKSQISHLKSELSIQKEKNKVWNEVIEEGYFVHENFIIKEVNSALEKITGYSKEELIGQHGKMLITEESYELLKRHLAKGRSELFEVNMITKSGAHIIVNTKGKTIKAGNQIQRVVIVQNINEFKKIQKSLEESEEKHRLISSLLSDYVYTCTIKPNLPPVIGWVSGAIKNICGYTTDEIEKLDHGWFSIIHPEDVQSVADSVNYNYQENKFYQNEYRIIDKKGNIRWLMDRSMCISFNESTSEITLLGATKDITLRKKFEEDLRKKNLDFEQLNKHLKKVNKQLKESETKYRNLIENTVIGVGITRGEKFLFANQALLKIFGVKTFEEIASRKLTDYMPPLSKKLVKERLKKYKANIHQENIYRHEIVRPDGKIRTLQINSTKILFEGKKCRQALVTDITSQLETENALQQAADIFKNIQIGLFIYRLDDLEDDRSLRMIAANPTSLELLGLKEKEIVGRKIDDIFPNLRMHKIPQQYAEVVRTHIPIAFDDIYYEDDRIAPSFYSIKVFPLPNQCVGISFENVSERRKTERELLTRNHELNNFVYKVSHDLRAPLSSIKGLINLFKLEKNPLLYLPKIEDRINHLDGFIRDILSHSRNLNTAIIIEKVDLDQIIENCFKELEYLSGSKSIKKSVSITGVDFYSDKIRLTEICRNMISNAIKYQDKKEKVKLLRINGNITKKYATLIFEDNGIGVESKFLDDIFKMFYRATEVSEGSGIGLYIVKQATEKLEGKITVQSNPNVGSKFTIKLPNLISKREN